MIPLLTSICLAASPFQPVVTQKVMGLQDTAPRLVTGTLSAPLTGDLPEAARAWALEHGAEYGLSPKSTLVSAEAFGTHFGASFHLQQQINGVEVYGAKLVVTIDAKARVVQVASSLTASTRVLDAWPYGRTEALRRAARDVPWSVMKGDVPVGATRKVLFVVGAEIHAGYIATVETLNPMQNIYVGLDAATGERLFVQDRVYHGALTANVYPVSPGGLDAGVGVTPTVSRELVRADGGSMVDEVCDFPLLDGGLDTAPNDGGQLCGVQLTSLNCCPTEGCAADAGPLHTTGVANYGGLMVPYDVAICDRRRRASNNPAEHSSGTFEYTPVDPPTNRAVVEGADPANSDEFAEVHSFYHVNRVYDWARELSLGSEALFPNLDGGIAPFTMRDERRTPKQKVAVWSNVMFPNFNELFAGGVTCLTNPPCKANTLLRMDNAAFMGVENFDQIPIDAFKTGVDTLMIFQGNSADAAYDATVLQHEFGHGIVTATANLSFDTLALDSRSANNEAGAMHEGFADYIAGAFNNLAANGPYFGPRALAGTSVGVQQESYLRTMDNTFTCPSVLWGEVHQDSQHFSAALWAARMGPFVGSDSGHTFDQAFYAMLVSLAPNADFASAAAAMSARAGEAFGAGSAQTMTDLFTARGVLGCSKIIDAGGLTVRRDYYGIAAAPSNMASADVPGPVQVLLHSSDGTTRVRVQASISSSNPLGAAAPVTLLVKKVAPITFTPSGTTITNDADAKLRLSTSGAAAIDVASPCGTPTDVYVSLSARGTGATLSGLQVTLEPATGCSQPVDAGVETTYGPAVGPDGVLAGPGKPGCGCGSAGLAPLAAMLALGLLRRRRA